MPSFLNHELTIQSTSEPSPKRAKIVAASSLHTTISAKLVNGAYASLQELSKDAEDVGDSLVASLRARASKDEARHAGRSTVDELKQIHGVQGFVHMVRDVVEQEQKYAGAHELSATRPKHDGHPLANGNTSNTKSATTSTQGAVLTLFGNAPTPKQLFSSAQTFPRGQTNARLKSGMPVEEMSLPNGLAATRITSLPNDSKRGPSFEDTFPPPYSLPPLQPPKSHKRSATRDTTIVWEFKDQLSRNKKGGYTVQSLTVGDWLGYGGTDSKDGLASPRERRKQRDRVLSSGESSLPPPTSASLDETMAREEDALFRRAYSSFAPSRDNAKALVPEETKSMLWWHKVGRERYNEMFAIDPALSDELPASLLATKDVSDESGHDHDEDFGTAVERFAESNEDAAMSEASVDMTDVTQVLRRTSELLETLASHQRIRNASLPPFTGASRAPMSPAPSLASQMGRPASPAEDELATYRSLRHELAYLILRLPPYAVAKLNGEQLSELGVNTLIPFEGRDVKGTMEEDQVARLAKYTAMATAAGIATLTRGNSSSNQHYSSPSARTPAIGQAANTRYGQASNYSSLRSPATQQQPPRAISNHVNYTTPSTTAARPSYGQQASQFPRPGAAQSSHGLSTQQYYQRPLQQSSSLGMYGGYGQSNAQNYSQNRLQYPNTTSSQALAQFQQRTAPSPSTFQPNAPSYQNQNLLNRTASPLKPVSMPLAPSPRPLQQQAYQPPAQQPSSGRGTPLSYPSQPQTPVNGYAQQPRAASGTPQPPTAPTPQPQPQTTAQTTGHA